MEKLLAPLLATYVAKRERELLSRDGNSYEEGERGRKGRRDRKERGREVLLE